MPDPEHIYMVASRAPIIVDGRPAAPGDRLSDFDPESKSGARHLESGAVVKVALPAPGDEPTADTAAAEETSAAAETEGASTAPKPRRRRRPDQEDHPDA